MRLRTLLRLLVAGLAVLVLTAATPQTTLSDVEDEVMCPVCGVALNIAEAPQADDQRALIRDLIAQGLTKDEIKQELVGEFGPNVLADPGDEGFAKANWLVPAVVALVLIGAALLLLPRWRRRAAASADAPIAADAPELSPDEQRRLDDDLARYR